jgi:hypothetical protein
MSAYQQVGQDQQPQQSQQQPQQQAGAKSLFTLTDGSTVDDMYVAQLAQQYLQLPVAGVSPTGNALQLQNGQTMPIAQVLSQLGAQVKSFRPLEADYSQVQPAMRAAMQGLPDDFRRKQYLEHYMGQIQPDGPAPVVAGMGEDWFVFDPRSSKWMAATNAPGMDLSDAAGYGVQGAKMAGSIAGGAIGAAGGLGLGSVPGAIAGAAAGGAGVDALTRAAFTMGDPSYAAVRDQMGEGEVLGDIGKGAAIDAVGAALPMAGGALLRSTLSPVSRMLSGGGAVAQNMGKVAGPIGRAADTRLGRDVTAAFMPGAAEAQLVGLGAQLPAMATRGAVKATGALGESKIGRSLFGEEAAAGLAKFRGSVLGPEGSQTTRELFSNIGGAIGRGRRIPEPSADDIAKFMPDAKVYRGSLLDLGTEEQVARELWRDSMKSQMGAQGRTWGSKIGSGVQTFEERGKSAESLARAAVTPVTKGLRYGGAAMERGGAGAQQLGKFGRGRNGYSLEDQIYGRLGAEEALGGLGRASIDSERYRRPKPPTYLTGG